jgi:hypothetical protein
MDSVEVFIAHGMKAYDPQLGRLLDPQRDREAVLKTYEHGVGLTDGIRANPGQLSASPKARTLSDASPRKRPWWRFW